MIREIQHWVHDIPRSMETHKPVERLFLNPPQGPFSSTGSKQRILEPVARRTTYIIRSFARHIHKTDQAAGYNTIIHSWSWTGKK